MKSESMDIWKSSLCAINNKKLLLVLLVLPVLVSSVLRVDYAFEDRALLWGGAFYLKLLKFAAIYAGVVWVLQLGRSCTNAALFFSAITLLSIEALLWLIGHVDITFGEGQITWQGTHLLTVGKGDVTDVFFYVSAFVAQQTLLFGLFMLLAMLIPPLLSFGRIQVWCSLKLGWIMRGFIAKGAVIAILPLWLLREGAAMTLPGLLIDRLAGFGEIDEYIYLLKLAVLVLSALSQFLVVLMNVMVGVIVAQAFLRGSRRISTVTTVSEM